MRILCSIMAIISATNACTVHVVDAMHRVGVPTGTAGGSAPAPLTRPVAAARGELVHLQAVVAASGAKAFVGASVDGVAPTVSVRSLQYHQLNTTLAPEAPPGRGLHES